MCITICNMKHPQCIVAHPQMQHSMKTAMALKNAGNLLCYETMSFYDPNKKSVFNFLRKIPSVSRFMRRCADSGLKSEEVKLHCQVLGLLLEIIARIDRGGHVYYRFYRFVANLFGRKVAKDVIRQNADAVIMYDYTAVSCFSYLAKNAPDKVKILDMSSIPTKIIDSIIAQEEEKGFRALFVRKRKRYSRAFCNYYHREIELADYFLSPSRSVTDGLIELGISADKIFQITFGVDLESFTATNKTPVNEDETVKFLFVGRMEAAKGIVYLLEAFKKLSKIRTDFQLVLVGDACGNEKLFSKLEYVHYEGVVSKSKMIQLYNSCHVFVFPSLWEGCSLSLMEALASGLPAVATYRSGILQFAEDGKESFCIPGGDSDALTQKLDWFLSHKDHIYDMGQRASANMQEYSWENYYKNIAEACARAVQ